MKPQGSVLKKLQAGYRDMHTPIPVKITDPKTGAVTEDKLVPALIAEFCDNAKAAMRRDPKLRVIVDRFPQPIIWTLRCKTAASDGVRIAMNPLFADQLLMQGQHMSKETKISSDKTKFFEFVFLHECFHEIYCHSKQSEFKEETRSGKNHSMANIAMDAEINRDIERCFNGRYAGVTKAINGITDGIDYYPYEDWMQIFDDYYTGKRSLPEAEDEPDGGDPYGDPYDGDGEDGNGGNSGGGSGNDIQHSPAYEAGYAKALEDIKNGLIDPATFNGFISEAFIPSTQEEQEQYDAGYKAAIKAYNKNKQGGNKQNQNANNSQQNGNQQGGNNQGSQQNGNKQGGGQQSQGSQGPDAGRDFP